MPAPTRTTMDDIVAAARELVDDGGRDALTMQAVAARVGVRAPSLYKRVRDRDELLGRVVERAAGDVGAVLRDAADGGDPAARLAAQARALRGYAHAHPHLFALIFAPLPDAARPAPDALARASAPVIDACERLVGPARSLDAARTVTAWAYGFLAMELAGAFQLGGDTRGAFDYGVEAIVRALRRDRGDAWSTE